MFKRSGIKTKITSIAGGSALMLALGGTLWFAQYAMHAQSARAQVLQQQTELAAVATHRSKAEILRSPASQLGIEAKAHSVFAIEIKAFTPRPFALGQEIELEARVESRRELDAVEFSWALPKGVTLLNGAKVGQLGSTSIAQVSTLSLRISIDSAVNQQIHLNVYKRLPNQDVIGQVAQFNTVDLNAIENATAKVDILKPTGVEIESSDKSAARRKVMQ